MSAGTPILWSLARSGQPIDSAELAAAIETQINLPPDDYRTRLLLRDSLDALRSYWGDIRMSRWVAARTDRDAVERAWQADLGEPGFPSIKDRLMDATRADTLLQFLRELGSTVTTSARLEVGGSAALILSVGLTRHTDDIHAVDEIPSVLRNDHALLEQLAKRYALRLAHFQSHYLPDGWRTRTRSLERFGQLDVFLVDPLDVLLSKLFSNRPKDLDDLRAAIPIVGSTALEERFKTSCGSLAAETKLRSNAERNWYILFGQSLPS